MGDTKCFGNPKYHKSEDSNLWSYMIPSMGLLETASRDVNGHPKVQKTDESKS